MSASSVLPAAIHPVDPFIFISDPLLHPKELRSLPMQEDIGVPKIKFNDITFGWVAVQTLWKLPA